MEIGSLDSSIGSVGSSVGSLDTSMSAKQAIDSEKQIIGAQIVTGSLDRLNTDALGNVNKDYQMQKEVLMSEAVGKGLTFNKDV